MTRIQNSNEYGSLNLEDLNNFEKSNEVVLPEDYKKFLIDHNGGVPVPNRIKLEEAFTDVQSLFGMHSGPYNSNIFEQIETFQNRIPSWYLPIGKDSAGNLYIMSLWEENKGVIAHWNQESEAPAGEADQYFDNLIHIANSFTEFLNKMTT